MDTIRVKVDLQCPFCGLCKTLRTPYYRKGVTCPECQQSVFLRWATGIEGETDKHGYYFHAYEPMSIHKINREFEDVFIDEDSFGTIEYRIRRRGIV